MEEYSEDNLISKTERFLSQSVLKIFKESLRALKSCERVAPLAENLGFFLMMVVGSVSWGGQGMCDGGEGGHNGCYGKVMMGLEGHACLVLATTSRGCPYVKVPLVKLGFHLHCEGWISVYCDPKRPQFLGSGTTNLDEFLVQGTRWSSGLVDVAISKFSPLIYGPLKTPTFLHSMCYAELALFPIFYFLSLWGFATIPQLCLPSGRSCSLQVSNTYFIVFSFIFLSSHSKHLYEVLATGSTFRHWVNEQRIWMMKSVTSHLYGSVDAFMKKLGMRAAGFFPTNKVDDVEQLKHYNMGVFDFQTSLLFLAPMVALVILNMASFAVGIARGIFVGE
ncbi:cellulose synthase-like protein G2 [Malus domestica]|uniref:cellulose synthase-like protein G2 n=1 Tax=Malus domestica TaxID=3750 RepID=UPI0039758513